MSDKKFVDSAELTQLGIDLYNYVRKLNVGTKATWHNEYLEANEIPCIAFKKESATVEKLNANIKGGYEAEIPFVVYYRDEVKDTKATLNIVQPLNMLADLFNEETDNGFPNLKITNEKIEPVSLEMTATPSDATGIENNRATFIASYRFTYRKKGVFE